MKLQILLTKERKPIDISNFEDEYNLDNSIFSTDSPKFKKLLYIINNYLTPQEKHIILYYSECGKQDALAKKLGVSTATVNKIIKSIREKIKEYYYDNNNS